MERPESLAAQAIRANLSDCSPQRSRPLPPEERDRDPTDGSKARAESPAQSAAQASNNRRSSEKGSTSSASVCNFVGNKSDRYPTENA